MPIQPTILSNISSNIFKIKLLLQGAQNTGKTVFGLGSQTMRTLHLDVDSYGITSARTFQGNVQMQIPPIRQDLIAWQPINTVKEMYDVLDYIDRSWKNIDLIVVDTITDFQKMLINEIRGTGMGTPLKDYEWGPVLYTLQQVTQRLKRLPIHVIYNAHESDTKRVFDGFNKFTPAFDGQFQDEFGSHFSEMWRYLKINQYLKDQNGISIINEQRWIQCQTDETFNAKNRANVLEKYEYPHIDYIFNKIFQRLNENPYLMQQAIQNGTH